MYTPVAFEMGTGPDVTEALRGAGFGHLVSHSPDTDESPGLVSTALPFVVDDELSLVRAHFAKANPHWRNIDGRQALLIIPIVDAYVSPRWYPSKAEHGKVVPTSNYELIHLHGIVKIHHDADWKRKIVEDLTRANEGRVNDPELVEPWAVSDAPASFIDGQLKAIVGIELRVQPQQRRQMRSRVVSDEYGRADHAQKLRSTAGNQEPMEPGLKDRCLADLARDGYTIIENVFDAKHLRTVRNDIQPLFLHGAGRNEFEGSKTRRLYSPLEDTRLLDRFVDHPIALGLLDEILEPNYLLSQLQVIDITPGEAAQGLHPDDGLYPWPRPRPPLGAATIIAIDDFTADNGATVVIPGSHRWDDHAPTPEEITSATPAVMPAGSMLFFLGTTWHGGGANRTDRSRMCVTAQYCAPWCRPQENFSLSVSRDRVAHSSEHLQTIAGDPFRGKPHSWRERPSSTTDAIAGRSRQRSPTSSSVRTQPWPDSNCSRATSAGTAPTSRRCR